MSNPHNLEVGQKLFRVTTVNRSRAGGNEEWVEITKVGRKWAHTGNGWRGERVHLKDLWVDGGNYSSPAQCYLTEEEYRERAEAKVLWRALRSNFNYRVPQSVKPDDIRKAAELLGIGI